jgi:group I intron endonuclease
MKTGIYTITNLVNEKFYIGSAIDIHNRWSDHRSNLRSNKHANVHLQRSWNKHGENSFKFEIKVLCDMTNLRKIEQIYLDEHVGNKMCYNIAINAEHSGTGLKQSKETLEKRSESLKGRKLSEEHKKKIGDANRGRIHGSKVRKNMSKAHKGKKLPPEQKQKISSALRGENGPNTKLTWDQVSKIRELYATGSYPSRKLAEMFGLKDKKTILDIVNNKTWKTTS